MSRKSKSGRKPLAVRSQAVGVSTNGIEVTPEWRRRQARRRAAQEKRWAKKAGPVTISYLPGYDPPPPKPQEKTPSRAVAVKPERPRTKFPFSATINGREAIVWNDWVEYPYDDHLYGREDA